MPLTEAPRFNRAAVDPRPELLAGVVKAHASALNASPWLYCGYAELPRVEGVDAPVTCVDAAVDNQFRLTATGGFEQAPVVVTTSLRTSRFAPLLFWEVLHALAPGGVWIDIDDASRCGGTELAPEDFPDREYFRECLRRTSRADHGSFVVHTYRKVAPSGLAARIQDRGWTFGILTSGSSPVGARMAEQILGLDLPDVEVIFCGPRPADAPDDERVRVIDLERPEPRGWITRKKNLLADAARHENLCLLHDRFEITPEWAAALQSYGPCFSFLTVPQMFVADRDGRFPQRYADYQVLFRTRDIQSARRAKIYNGPDVVYAAYDDFYETAFCCGGLYIAKRSLWNRVRQDEGLFHCEWEDVTFGLDCQRRGLPHRVNTALTAESRTPHPMALTRIHEMTAPDRPALGTLHVVPAHAEAARAGASAFKPVFSLERDAYFQRVVDRFNQIPGVRPEHCLSMGSVADCNGLTQFWRLVESRILELPLRSRAEIAEAVFFLSDTIYNWPNCEVQAWIRANERRRHGVPALDRYEHIVGWGTGSLFRSAQRSIGRDLKFVVDSQATTWGTTIGGLAVRPPTALRELDPKRTAVVVFSCFVDDIAAAARREGPFDVVTAHDVLVERRFSPLTEMLGYFEEVERYYPAIFRAPCLETVAA